MNTISSSPSTPSSPSYALRFFYHLLRRYQLYLIFLLVLLNSFTLFRLQTLSRQLDTTKQLLRKTLLSWNQGFPGTVPSTEATIPTAGSFAPTSSLTHPNRSSSSTSTHTLSVTTSPFSYLLPWCLPSMPLDTLCRIPIVIYAYNRPDILKQTLDSIAYAAMNTPYTYVSIFISVDGPDAPSLSTALNWESPSSLPTSPFSTFSSIPNVSSTLFPAQAFIQKILVHPVIDLTEQRQYHWNILLLKRHWWWLLQSIFHSIHPSPYIPTIDNHNNDHNPNYNPPDYNNEKQTNMKYSFPYRTPLAIIPDLANYNSDILFLEEDSEVTPDTLIIFRSLSQLKYQGSVNLHTTRSKEARTGVSKDKRRTPGPNTSTSASSSSSSESFSLPRLSEIGMLVLSRWGSSYGNERPYDYYVEYAHGNLGYGFNYSFWRLLENQQHHFWSFHDGWDYSLYHLQQTNCLPPAVIGPQLPRLKHIGYEGLTTTKSTYLDAGYHRTKLSNVSTFDILEKYGTHRYIPEVTDYRTIHLHPVNKPCRGCGSGTQKNPSNGEDTGPTDICKLCHGERSMECFSRRT